MDTIKEMANSGNQINSQTGKNGEKRLDEF